MQGVPRRLWDCPDDGKISKPGGWRYAPALLINNNNQYPKTK